MVPDRQKVRTDGMDGRMDGMNGRMDGMDGRRQNYIPLTSSGDNNHIQNFHLGRYIVRKMLGNHVLLFQ